MITDKDLADIFEDDRKDINAITFEQIPYLLSKCGKNVAESTASYEFLDSMTKNTIAKGFGRATGGVQERNMESLSSKEYETHQEAVKDARELMLFYKTQYESLQAKFSYFQAKNANERAEMNLR